jgi:hypothetical protein
MEWKIYYDDGTTRDDSGGFHVPLYGVVVILQRRSYDGRYGMVSGTPYYLFHKNEWLPARENDIVDYLLHGKKIDKLVMGRLMTKTGFVEIFERAKADRLALD